MKLSVVLATFNEEANIAGCLETVGNIADEIIVVDGSSKDATARIAKDLGAKVTVTTNPPIFHINKQKAIDKATKDWVLQLDADERVTEELGAEIKKVIEENSKDGYWIPRKNLFLGKFLMKGGQYPDYTLRLYKRGRGRLPQKDVHEQAVVDGEVGYLTHPLVHLADPSFRRYLLRFGRYTDLIASELSKKQEKIGPLSASKHLIVLPIWWFLLTYVRHKGFMDSWQGFVFSFFSALRFPISYLKYIRGKL
jgi:glycosyltransferase involved in cell wall biosynthesis